MTKKSMSCPHCGTAVAVWRNGSRCCPNCGKTFRVEYFDIAPVKQPDDVSCGWATTLWLLRSFGEIGNGTVAAGKLREELNTDAKRGVRPRWNESRVRQWIEALSGRDLEAGKGTLPKAIYDALSERGLTLKNPIRAESPTAFKDYLEDAFREGGRAAMLLWRLDGFMHWMGVDKKDGQIRVMDPAVGGYLPFDAALAKWNTKKHNVNFLVFGIVRK